MKTGLNALKVLIAVAAIGGAGYVLYTQAGPLLAPPCSTPIQYSIGAIDPKFGISQSQFTAAIAKAVTVWNTEAGRTLIEAAPAAGHGMPVNLVYSEVQRATELGKNIDADQAAYNAQKAEVNALKDRFNAAKASYEAAASAYEARTKAYQAEVAHWNSVGGAPPADYARLKQEGQELDTERINLNNEADAVNALAKDINAAVAQLNLLARNINAKVGTYNKNAGEDFEQGHYVEDSTGKHIDIYEFKNTLDLERVLGHEFGHALGLGHVENPDSIMYSFNIGSGLDLTAEDIAELQAVCKLKK